MRSTPSRSFVQACALTGVAWLSVALAATFSPTGVEAQAVAAVPTRSVAQGVYTEAEAERGRGVFDRLCTDCHAARMWGGDWDGKTVGDVYEVIANFMPEPNPGSMTAAEVRDVIAHILKSNDVPTGTNELPPTLEALKDIKLERPPAK